MKKRFILILMASMFLLGGCSKKESLDKELAVEKESKEEAVLSEEEKERYIKESNIMDYFSQEANYDIRFVYLKAGKTPEILCTYNTEGTLMDWESKLIILSYEEKEEKWAKIFEENKSIMEPLATIKADDKQEIALYNHHSGGTAGLIGVESIRYDLENEFIIKEYVSSTINYGEIPEYIENEKAIYFEGFSHGEKYIWNGRGYNHEIFKLPLEVDSDIEIHFTIQNGEIVFAEKDIFSSPLQVEKGDVISFIQDNPYGGMDRLAFSEGLEKHERSNRSFIVREDGIQHISMRINAEWHEFKFLSGKEDISNLKGKKITEEDLQIRTSSGVLVNMYSNFDELMELLEGGKKEEHGVSDNNEDAILFGLHKDGFKCFYYDVPSDPDYGVVLDALVVDRGNHSTYRGLKVGDTYEKMIELYGEPEEVFTRENTDHCNYETEDEIYIKLGINIDRETKTVSQFGVFLEI